MNYFPSKTTTKIYILGMCIWNSVIPCWNYHLIFFFFRAKLENTLFVSFPKVKIVTHLYLALLLKMLLNCGQNIYFVIVVCCTDPSRTPPESLRGNSSSTHLHTLGFATTSVTVEKSSGDLSFFPSPPPPYPFFVS